MSAESNPWDSVALEALSQDPFAQVSTGVLFNNQPQNGANIENSLSAESTFWNSVAFGVDTQNPLSQASNGSSNPFEPQTLYNELQSLGGVSSPMMKHSPLDTDNSWISAALSNQPFQRELSPSLFPQATSSQGGNSNGQLGMSSNSQLVFSPLPQTPSASHPSSPGPLSARPFSRKSTGSSFNPKRRTTSHNEFLTVGSTSNPAMEQWPGQTDGALISGAYPDQDLNLLSQPSLLPPKPSRRAPGISNGYPYPSSNSQPMAPSLFTPPTARRSFASKRLSTPPTTSRVSAPATMKQEPGNQRAYPNLTFINEAPHLLPSPPLSQRRSRGTPSTRPSISRKPEPGRMALTAGVHKPYRRTKPLGEIKIMDPNDPLEVKRAQNTEAARRSRQKKVQQYEEQEAMIAELEEANSKLEKRKAHWKLQAEELEEGNSNVVEERDHWKLRAEELEIKYNDVMKERDYWKLHAEELGYRKD